MNIPNIDKNNIFEAIKYIDENGVPDKNKSTKYQLVLEDGRSYPPKYVIAVADYLANGEEINTDNYNSIMANSFFKKSGFTIETKQEKYELTITADEVVSTDERFTMDNISLGDGYKPLDVYFENADGEIIRRNYSKGERRNSNQTMPRIACQVFESSIVNLSKQEREQFPICRYSVDGDMICGIFSSVEEFKKYRNTIEYMTYTSDEGVRFVIYCWNIFSTIYFSQECLKRFGKPGDKIVLSYREKDEKEVEQIENDMITTEELAQQFKGYNNPYSSMLIQSKNIIFRGAPGTGKSYLAKEIAADIISNGYFNEYELLSDEQKKQVEFVQFHPSYDYSDFVEGLRPKMNDDGSMGFELQDGVFKKFVARARKNYEDSLKSKKTTVKTEELKKYIFIIDEINRGEISKILGELFFSIDPGYRGKSGEVSTQYANMHADPDEKFYIPENVYIIGTMNDIDRSVDSFDFAMRRRFRFVEIKADERLEMLDLLDDEELKAEAIKRLTALNNEIVKVEDLNENYQIGASYFLKLRNLSFDELWTDCLQPLLQDYVQGMYDEKGIMERFAKAYGYKSVDEGSIDEATQD